MLGSLRALLDASVLSAAVLAIGFAVLVAPQAAGELDATLALALAYNALGVAALVPALFLVLGSRRALPLPIALVAAGLLASALGDTVYTWLEATGAHHSGHPVDLLWAAHYLLCASAAVVALRRSPAAPARARAQRDVGLGLVVAAIASLACFWLLERETWIAAVLGGTLVVMLVRLLVTAREHRRTAAELAAALAAHELATVTDRLTGPRNRAGTEAILRAHS